MICPNCNSQLPDGAQFCNHCGESFFNVTQPQNIGGFAPASQPAYNSQPPQPPKNNTGLIIGIIVGVLALIVTIVAIVLLKKEDSKDSKDKDNNQATESNIDDPTTTPTTTEAEPATTESEPATTEADVNTYEYDGTYYFASSIVDGETYSKEELEEASGEDFYMTMVIDGDTCTLNAPAMDINNSTCNIEIDGTSVTLNNGSENLYGTYDPYDHSISVTSEGIDLIFVHSDYLSDIPTNNNSGSNNYDEANYDGTYSLDRCTMDGMTYSKEELEEAAGETFDMYLIVNGDTCTLDAEAMGIDKASCLIEFDGTTVTLVDGAETIVGTYDPAEESISITSQGVEMIFVK